MCVLRFMDNLLLQCTQCSYSSLRSSIELVIQPSIGFTFFLKKVSFLSLYNRIEIASSFTF